MVTAVLFVLDSIVVHTVPADGSQAHVWTGLPDGTYTLEPLDMDYLAYKAEGVTGTTVILQAKKGSAHEKCPRRQQCISFFCKKHLF